MIRTHGLTHVALGVRDASASFRFYEQVFGVVKVYHEGGFLQAQTPGTRDVLVFDESATHVGKRGGIAHFGFRLVDASDIDAARSAVEAAGGKVREQGEFAPGAPYLFATDLDGYEIEIWFEPPTLVDPA